MASLLPGKQAVELVTEQTPSGEFVESVSVIHEAPSFAHDELREVVLCASLATEGAASRIRRVAELTARGLDLPFYCGGRDLPRWWHQATEPEAKSRCVRVAFPSGDEFTVDTTALSPDAGLRGALEDAARRSGRPNQRVTATVELATPSRGTSQPRMALKTTTTTGSDDVPDSALRLLSSIRWAPQPAKAILALTTSHQWMSPGDIGVGLHMGFDAPTGVTVAIARWFAGELDDDALSNHLRGALLQRALVPSPFGHGRHVQW